jgi:hypothetical protein
LMSEVDKCCEEIKKQEESSGNGKPRIDYLVMTQGNIPFHGREGELFQFRSTNGQACADLLLPETEEGLDKFMSLLYYSRMRMIQNFLPLLRNSTFPAHVLTVYAAGKEKEKCWFPNDLSLRHNFAFAHARTHIVTMTTLYMEEVTH